jgi:hypothetical protein
MKYGLGGLNKTFNPSQNNNFAANISGEVNGLISVGRVISIVLDESHPRFNELGGYGALGTIEIDNVKIPSAVTINRYPTARPLFANISNYPLINEIVVILTLPNQSATANPNSTTSYYISTISAWSHPHCNPLPYTPNQQSTKPDSDSKNYSEVIAGSTNIVSNTTKEFKLGNTFKERSNIHPLLTFEGDVIYEGRWGNSIRLSSTVQNGLNNWSTVGTGGDPILILRNGQPEKTSNEGWTPVVEDVNKDLSSIYLTSTQQVPITVAQTNYNSYSSYIPVVPTKYQDNQIILNSGRLVFNSNKDHILLSSALTIGFNAVKGFNFDTKTNFIVNAPTIKLGGKEATESILKGDTTISLLSGLVVQLTALSTALQTVTTDSGPAVAPAAAQLISYLTKLKVELETTTKSKISKTL